MIKFIPVFILILIFVVIGILASKKESKRFNDGICPQCGERLLWFDNDSQGGRGYICHKCWYCTWVSCNGVDKKFRKNYKENNNE